MRVLLAIVFLVSCNHDALILAKVNSDSITMGQFKTRLKEIDFDQTLIAPPDLLSLKKYILNEMIEDKIIQQQSVLMNISVSEQEIDESISRDFAKEDFDLLLQNLQKKNISREDWRGQMKQKILAEKIFHDVTQQTPVPSEQELMDFYKKNMGAFSQKEQIHVLQIVTASKDEARKSRQRVLQGEDFLAVANSSLQSPDMTPHGDLGFVTRGILPDTIENKVFAMKTNSVSPILEVSPNFYIMKVIEKKNAKQLSFEESRQQIQNMLLADSKDKTYTNWLQGKMIQAKIKRNDELLKENIHL